MVKSVHCTLTSRLESPFFLSIDYFMPSFLHLSQAHEKDSPSVEVWFGPAGIVDWSHAGVLEMNIVFAIPIQTLENGDRSITWK